MMDDLETAIAQSVNRTRLERARLVVFDVDGTLVKTKTGREFREAADDWELLPGRRGIIHHLQAEMGKKVALATNQGGVAFGFCGRLAMDHQTALLAEDLRVPGGYRVRYYSCYCHPEGTVEVLRCESFHRKPNPGMILDACLDQEVGPPQTLMVGDRPEDREAAGRAGAMFIDAHEFFAMFERYYRVTAAFAGTEGYCFGIDPSLADQGKHTVAA